MANKIIRPLWAFAGILLIVPKLVAGLTISDLRCERLTNPLSVDCLTPQLSWIVESQHRNTMQEAYQVLVASSAEKLDRNEGDLWDSGKCISDRSIGVVYAGTPLKSKTDCFWKVKVWTNKGESAWSDAATWSVGLLNYKDWAGRWIGFDRAFPHDSNTFHSRLSARYFRKEFNVGKQVAKARVYLIGVGLYELFLNGQKVGDQVLAPSPTDYLENVKYNAFDVTGYLNSGANAIGVILGNGRYYTMRQNYKSYKIKNFGYPKMLLQLELEYTDGSRLLVKTDDTWRGTANGPIVTNNEYDGEEYDARKEFYGWDRPGFDDSKWLAAEYVDEVPGRFEAQMNPHMKVMMSLKPVSLTEKEKGRYILDMGQNITGWVKMKVKGNTGDRVKLRFAEILTEDGELFTANLRDALVTDIYTLKGSGTETWEPRFVYHGFQFVEITGYPGKPTIDDFTGQMVYDDMETIGTFTSSDSILNQIYRNAWWGIAGNYKGMPIDCPQRNERQPWLGDRTTVCYGESYLFDNHKLYEKWADDIGFTQKWDGAICDVAPNYWRYYSDNVTWPGTYLMVAEMLRIRFGDTRPIEKHYVRMKRWMDYMRTNYMNAAFIITKDSYGDWCFPPATIEEGRGKSADKKFPSQLISTAYYYHLLQLMHDFAAIKGEPIHKEEFNILAQKVKNGFHQTFYKGDGIYGNNSLTDNVLALGLGLVPEEEQVKVAENIAAIITENNKGHLSTGIVGTGWLMRTLTEMGRTDLAFRIATNTGYPSWGYMVENGANTIWELWNGNTAAPNMNSYNHVMLLGDLLVWYYEHLAGIRSCGSEAGFKAIIMKPGFEHGLSFVNASYQSVHGLIESKWEKTSGEFSWLVTVPANTNAKVYVPAQKIEQVQESGKPATNQTDVKFLGMENDKAVFEIGSGKYHFKSKL